MILFYRFWEYMRIKSVKKMGQIDWNHFGCLSLVWSGLCWPTVAILFAMHWNIAKTKNYENKKQNKNNTRPTKFVERWYFIRLCLLLCVIALLNIFLWNEAANAKLWKVSKMCWWLMMSLWLCVAHYNVISPLLKMTDDANPPAEVAIQFKSELRQIKYMQK